MKEIEVKILEINEKDIKAKLRTFAKKVSDAVLLTTTTFNNPYNDALVRLRTQQKEAVFTVKTKIPDKRFKIRKEYETKIADPEIFKKQLEILGFKQAMLQEKKRTTYKYKDSEIVIDKYPKIPAYLEIEGNKNQVQKIVNKLGYKMSDTTNINVYGLFRFYNVNARNLRF